jgi:Raf kinase inhibitor-like YbhB/YbcL family protein
VRYCRRHVAAIGLCAVAALLPLGCGSETTTSIEHLRKPPMLLSSPAFRHGGTVPDCYADPLRSPPSPPLEWTNVPDSTRCFALILYEAEALADGEFATHWLALNLPGDTRYLPEGAGSHGTDAGGGCCGYAGMRRPARRPHRFVFALYALDAPVTCTFLPTGPAEVEDAAAGHILAKAELACYTRLSRF